MPAYIQGIKKLGVTCYEAYVVDGQKPLAIGYNDDTEE
ncbi:DUF1398 domain-containing protein [Sphingobacterium sp. E70]|nr:DUF1398 domain-containing protein [Sphingobacterium sp. E70]ULT25091.1 DUF1398 domain-containing protein [Sphingobacterium sp. E70]